MVILASIPRSSMAQLREEYLENPCGMAMITKNGAISSEEHMTVILWDLVQAIVCSGQQAMIYQTLMIMYGIGLTAITIIGTMEHWIFGKSEVIILQVSLVKVKNM